EKHDQTAKLPNESAESLPPARRRDDERVPAPRIAWIFAGGLSRPVSGGRPIENALGTNQGGRVGHVSDRALLNRYPLPDRRWRPANQSKKSGAARAGGSAQDPFSTWRLRRGAQLL